MANDNNNDDDNDNDNNNDEDDEDDNCDWACLRNVFMKCIMIRNTPHTQ